jgi:hypothetical protein
MGTLCTTCFNSEYLCFMEYCKGLRVFENRAVDNRSAKDTVTGGWTELHYKRPIIFLATKYCQSDLIKDGQVGGTCSTYWSMRHAYNILKPWYFTMRNNYYRLNNYSASHLVNLRSFGRLETTSMDSSGSGQVPESCCRTSGSTNCGEFD